VVKNSTFHTRIRKSRKQLLMKKGE